MNLDKFVVRPRVVEKYAKAESWAILSSEAISELSHEVAGWPAELDPEGEEARALTMRSSERRRRRSSALTKITWRDANYG